MGYDACMHVNVGPAFEVWLVGPHNASISLNLAAEQTWSPIKRSRRASQCRKRCRGPMAAARKCAPPSSKSSFFMSSGRRPGRLPFALVVATPSLVRSEISLRSKSATAPNTWKISSPAAEEVSIFADLLWTARRGWMRTDACIDTSTGDLDRRRMRRGTLILVEQ